MRKNSKFLAIVLAFAMVLSMAVIPVSASNVESANLLADANCGFEDGKISPMSGGATDIKALAAAARNGSYGASFTARGSVHDLRTDYNVYNTTVDTPYTAGYWIKAADSSAVGKTAQLRFQVNDGGAYLDGPKVTISDEWQLVKNDYLVPANQNMRIGTIITSGAAVYVDDFFLEKSANVLIGQNNGFESNKLSPWASTASPTIDAGAAHTGNYGASFTATGSVHNLRTDYKAYNTVDTYYTVGYWVKAADSTAVGQTAKARFQVADDANGTSAVSSDSTTAVTISNNWQLVIHEYKVPAGKYMRIGTIITSGAVYVDDFFLEANAASLIGENAGFEDGSFRTGYQSTNGKAVVTNEAGAAHTGSYGAKVSQESFSVHNLRTEFKTRNTADQWFEAGAWVKAVDADSVGKDAFIRFQYDNGSGGNETKDGPKTTLTDGWQYISFECKIPADRKMRVAPMFGDSNVAVNAYVDDLVLEAFTPAACTVTTDMEDDAVDQATEVEINYTFSNELSAALAVENFAVTPEGATVAVDGNKLTLSGLDNGTKYTVALANATDKYGQNVSDTLSFTTVAAAYDEEVLWGFEGSYNNETYSGSIHTGTTGTISTDVKYAGNQSLQVVTDGEAYTANNNWKPDVIAQNKCTNIELGVPYIVSYYAKTAEGTNRVGLNVSSTKTAENTVQVEATKYATFEINDKEWTKVTCYVVAKAGNGAEKLGLHMAIFARVAGTYYVDQLEIKKATALDLDGSYYAVKSKNAVSGDVELSLYTAAAKTVYLLAAQYEGENFVGAKLDKVDLTDKASYTATLSGVGENDRIFVWDGSLKPLNKELKLTDF
ncbi:MAG: hypothetical protein IJ300_07600 [Clostridia bacterium]|nr:hypothetical protein [Clostridia bacterium]